jgi:fatty acid desaturase
MSVASPPMADPANTPHVNATNDWTDSLPTGLYPELKQRIRAAGLLRKQPRYYTVKITGTVLLAVPSVVVMFLTRNPFVQIVNALYLAAVFAQFGFLGHDIGHTQVVRKGPVATTLKLFFGPVLIGVSSTWWVTKHNAHHGHPNREGSDPDISLPIVAFSDNQVRAMNRMQRMVVRWQHVLLPFMLLFEGIVLRLSGIVYLLSRRGRRWAPELTLIAIGLVAYGGLIYYTLGLGTGIMFVLIQQAAFGLYMGSVFAPNHKGMPVLDGDAKVDFLLEQVVTSRNVSGGRATDFFFGALNYQIEHHLFPTMARNQLHRAQPLVVAFCAEKGVPYVQTGVLDSYRMIFGHLRDVGASTALPLPGRVKTASDIA